MPSFPNRCQHLKINGTQCGSPALRRNRFCYFHKRFQDEQIKLSADRARRGTATFVLPVLEDANSVQIALMQVMRLLVAQKIDHKTASLLLYALQTASSNLRQVNFNPHRNYVILDPRDARDNALDADRLWCDDDFKEEPDEEEDEVLARAHALDQVRIERQRKEKLREWSEKEFDRLQAEGRVIRAREDAEIAAHEAALDANEARAEAFRKSVAEAEAAESARLAKRMEAAKKAVTPSPAVAAAPSSSNANAAPPVSTAGAPKKPATAHPGTDDLKQQFKQAIHDIFQPPTYPPKKEDPKTAS